MLLYLYLYSVARSVYAHYYELFLYYIKFNNIIFARLFYFNKTIVTAPILVFSQYKMTPAISP